MNQSIAQKNIYTGILLAVVATIIWSGNFIVARGVYKQIPPVSLAFYRWLTACIIMLPVGYKAFQKERSIVLSNWKYMLFVALTGIAIFNTFVYIAGRYTTAINMSLIGTTSSPIFAILISVFVLKESIRPLRVVGLVLCIMGILVLLSKGSINTLLAFRFSIGDVWILFAALSFAVYNILVRRKPNAMSPVNFLFVSFTLGTLILLPFFIVESINTLPIVWNAKIVLIILYLGLGTSVVAFLMWNAAIEKLGAVRASLFGNLIPIFSSVEAVWLLGEEITTIHLISGALVITGLIISNLKSANAVTNKSTLQWQQR
jgi:drug/metabolite transporter (DMT)-like permease